MTLYCFDLVVPRVPSVAIHLESDMTWDGPLGQGPDQNLTESTKHPFCRRRMQEPTAYTGEVEVRHVVGERATKRVSKSSSGGYLRGVQDSHLQLGRQKGQFKVAIVISQDHECERWLCGDCDWANTPRACFAMQARSAVWLGIIDRTLECWPGTNPVR